MIDASNSTVSSEVNSAVKRDWFRRWHDLVTRRVALLGDARSKSLPEVRASLSHLLDLVGLGWSMLRDSRKEVGVSVPSTFRYAEAPSDLLDELVPELSSKGPVKVSDVAPEAKVADVTPEAKVADAAPEAAAARVPPARSKLAWPHYVEDESPLTWQEIQEIKKARKESVLWWQKEDRYARFFTYVRWLLREASMTDGPRLAKGASLDKCVSALARLAGVTFTREQLRSPKDPHGRFVCQVLVALGRKPDLAAAEKVTGGLSVLLADVEKKLGVRYAGE